MLVIVNLIFLFTISLAAAKMMNPTTEKVLFDFHSIESKEFWTTINDGVMGGISNSTFSVNPQDSTATFSGYVSLENNGGFASVRTYPIDFQLDGYNGIVLRVKGDGNIYSFRLRVDDYFDGISYRAKFQLSLIHI